MSERPLDVRPDVLLEDDQLRALRVLEAFDLTPVRSRLLRNEAMPAELVDEAIFEFRRYLGLRVVANRPITMLSRQVDDVWHTCLLFTRLYENLCNESCGYFIHHDPNIEPDPDPFASWREFEQAYRSLFGEPGSLWQIWRPDI